MGLLSDFFVATPEVALHYPSLSEGGNSVSANRVERAEYKNFTPLALEMLWAVLRREQRDAKRHGIERVSRKEEDEQTWLFRFPDELVHLVSALDEPAEKRVADAWVSPGDVPGDSDELRQVLRDLKRLAIVAQTDGRNLYLWVAL
jgi:hypothetical protein